MFDPSMLAQMMGTGQAQQGQPGLQAGNGEPKMMQNPMMHILGLNALKMLSEPFKQLPSLQAPVAPRNTGPVQLKGRERETETDLRNIGLAQLLFGGM